MSLRGILAIILTLALICAFAAACAPAVEAPEEIGSGEQLVQPVAAETENERKTRSVSGDAREMGRDSFSKLVEDGVISQETYDKMKVYMEASRGEIKARLEEIKPEQPDSPGKTRTGLLDRLLEAGVITQSEYDALKDAMQNPGKLKNEARSSEDQASRNNPFSRFVTEGIISQETADAIKEYMDTDRSERASKLELVKPDGPADLLGEMLEAEIITQSEYDAIKEALPELTEKLPRADEQNRIAKQSA